MTTLSPASLPAAGAARPAAAAVPQGPGRRVIDAPTRLAHWLIAASFAGAYLSADSEHWRAVHVAFGWTMMTAVGFRLLYALVGPRPARLGVLWRKALGLPDWLRGLVRAGGLPGALAGAGSASTWRSGALQALGWTAFALLALALPLGLSGWATFNEWGATWGGDDLLAELHEALGNAMLGLVLAHLGLIAGLSLLLRRNQARTMWSGRIAGSGPDLVPNNRVWLAALLLVGALAVAGWQWTQATAQAPARADAAQMADDDDDD